MQAMIPPELRALARVVSDVDCTQFPELFTPVGLDPPVQELEILLAEITGAPLSAREFRLFQAALLGEKHHLRGVNAATVTETQVGAALSLTSRIDTTCTKAEVPLALVFPHVKEAHNFFLGITTFKCSVKQAPVFYRLFDVLCTLFLRALEELQRYTEGPAPRTITKGVKKLHLKEQRHSGSEEEDDAMLWLQGLVTFPVEFECAFADIDGDVALHLAHLRWYVEVCQQSFLFDSSMYLKDISMRRIWNACVGKDKPACFAENFVSALEYFPEWSRVAIMEVLDYGRCGVVSLYSLQRLLDVWGPFLLLSSNMKDDVRVGMFDLGHSLEYQRKAFAQRPDAAEGDCVAALTNTPGDVVALILLRRAGNRENVGNGCSLVTREIHFTHKTGAWVAEGLTMAEYDTIFETCCAFPEVFHRPCGSNYGFVQDSEDSSAQAEFTSTSVHTVSSLHRACFRNNERYVKTLLARGSTVVVNVALSDPAISSEFTWTPLLCAVNNPISDPGTVVRSLLEVGADVHVHDEAQCTALYYAIANGYVNAAHALLEHCPHLHTSSSSKPLLIALGAHHFHACESDIRRLSDLVPSADMFQVLLPYQKDLRLVRLCVDIIRGKLGGVERKQLPTDDPSIWHPDGRVGLWTPEEETYLSEIVAHHGKLCRQFRGDVVFAARLLYNHCYYLSSREFFEGDTQDHDDS